MDEIERQELNRQKQGEYVEKVTASPQFTTIQEALRKSSVVLGVIERRSAIVLKNHTSGQSGARVDFLYKASIKEGPEDCKVNIQSFFPDTGGQETVAYLRIGNTLLDEFYSDETILKAAKEGYIRADWDSTALLTQRDYEKDSLLE